MGDIPTLSPGCSSSNRFVGPANASAQYNAVVGYESLLDSHIEPISIDVGLREPTLTTANREMRVFF